MSEQKAKLRKKLYKSGKHWVVAGIAFFGMTAGLTTVASADGDVVPAVTTEQVEAEAVTSISQTPVASVATISQDEYTNVMASSEGDSVATSASVVSESVSVASS